MSASEQTSASKRVEDFTIVNVIEMPEHLEEGIIYISEEYDVSIHLCACGCKQKTVMPLGPKGWDIRIHEGKVSFTPSIGNFSWEGKYHAHYFITENKVQWCEPPTLLTSPHKPDDFAPYELEP